MDNIITGLGDLIIDNLKSVPISDFFVVFGAWVFSPLLSYFYVERSKKRRRAEGKPRQSSWVKGATSGLVTFALSFFITYRMGGWTPDEAFNHSLLAAIGFPLLVWFYKALLRRKDPDLADDFGSDVLDSTLVAPGGSNASPAPVPEQDRP